MSPNAVNGQIPPHMRRDTFDPVADLTQARTDQGVISASSPWGTQAWLVTRYADVRQVLGDAKVFSNASLMREAAAALGMSAQDEATARAGNLLAYDPPEHTRLRRMLTPEFTVRRIRRLEPRTVELVADRLDAMEKAGAPADLVTDFALPIPSLVICELLGVPYEDRDEFQHRTSRQLDTAVPIDERNRLQLESLDYMARLVAQARANPGEDMMGMLVRDHGDDLTTPELVGIASQILIAGHETTSNMLSLGTLALLRHPEQLVMMRDDPACVDNAVEELMRWLSIVPSGAPKVATEDVAIAGQAIKAGETVMCAHQAANRDPALTEDPDRFDITRGSTNHVGFGHGVHHCLGAPLARMEMRIAFPALLRRFPDLYCTIDFDKIEFRDHHMVYGLKSLPVAW